MKSVHTLLIALALGLAPLAHAAETPRPGVLDPRIQTVEYDPDQVVVLRGTLPARVRLEVQCVVKPVHALVDAMQFQQVVMNLCTNAWQALPEALRAGQRVGADHARRQQRLVRRHRVGEALHEGVGRDARNSPAGAACRSTSWLR